MRQSIARPSLWHVREEKLAPGAVIEPGRWGKIVIATGQDHPFFFREQLLELYRLDHTRVPVSRLSCSFAFEERVVAAEWAQNDGQILYRVEPADADEAGVRLDMLWLTWLGERGSTVEMNMTRCRAYWMGQSTRDSNPTAKPGWEWLFVGGLRVIDVDDV